MAYNDLNVTSIKTDEASGPVWWNPNPRPGIDGFDYEPLAADGWVQIGDASTDGYSFEQSSDSNDKRVFGRNLGTLYSNFKDKLTIQLAATTDPDVLKVVYGSENVAVDPTTKVITLSVRGRQPQAGALRIHAKTDDGRRVVLEAPKVVPDINVSKTWTDEDVTVLETAFDMISVNGYPNHLEYYEGLPTGA